MCGKHTPNNHAIFIIPVYNEFSVKLCTLFHLFADITDYETSIFMKMHNFPKIIIVHVCDLFIVLYNNVAMQKAVISTIMTLVFTLHCVKKDTKDTCIIPQVFTSCFTNSFQ